MNTTREQTVVLSFFRFHRSKYLWAMSRMAIVPMQLKKENKISFFKMLGTGGGYGYSFKPDFSTYALLTVWDSSEEAKQFESDSDVMRRFHRQAVEVYSIFMRPVQSRGKWSGVRPFNPVQPAEDNVPLAVLTRATLKPYYYLSFWRRVGKVSRSHATSPGTMFTKGVGERPWIAQATFSVWESFKDMQAFAYGSGTPHLEAIQNARNRKGFREELFAWFTPLFTRGSWNGSQPI
jgi:hypothetical protein